MKTRGWRPFAIAAFVVVCILSGILIYRFRAGNPYQPRTVATDTGTMLG